MRAVIVASGNLDDLPAEVQTVANLLSNSGWTVRLCLGSDASRAGLLAAAGEGMAQLCWFGLHSGKEGFELADGVWPPAQVGVWLHNIEACDVVLNACYSLEHVESIQRAANVNVACTIDPDGVDSTLAWQVGVYLIRAYLAKGSLQQAVRQASGLGSLQYRFIPASREQGSRSNMPPDRIEDQLTSLLRAVRGDTENGVPGLVFRMSEMQRQLTVFTEEQRAWREEQRAWREQTEHRLNALESMQRPVISNRMGTVLTVTVVVAALLILFLLMRWGGASL